MNRTGFALLSASWALSAIVVAGFIDLALTLLRILPFDLNTFPDPFILFVYSYGLWILSGSWILCGTELAIARTKEKTLSVKDWVLTIAPASFASLSLILLWILTLITAVLAGLRTHP